MEQGNFSLEKSHFSLDDFNKCLEKVLNSTEHIEEIHLRIVVKAEPTKEHWVEKFKVNQEYSDKYFPGVGLEVKI